MPKPMVITIDEPEWDIATCDRLAEISPSVRPSPCRHRLKRRRVYGFDVPNEICRDVC